MRWLFVVVPWHSAHYPSLSTGILKSIAREHNLDMVADVLYANLRWIDHVRSATGGTLDLRHYHVIGEDLIFKGTGEWVFAAALHQSPEWRPNDYRKTSGLSDENFELALTAHRLAPGFIDTLAREIVDAGYDHVGLTSTFMQNAACLALARRLKQLAPDITLVMGGGNCDGPQGPALHRNFQDIDYVVSGEGEFAFRSFLKYREGELEVGEVPGLSWRDDSGRTHTNPIGRLAQMKDVPTPDYDDYFDQVFASDTADQVELNIVVESARGCWWGQKHHCTFCGLNGTGMEYRLKDGDAFLDEIEGLTAKYQTLDIITADNIIGMDYFHSVLPGLRDRGMDLRIHYEVKANLRHDQLVLLRAAGVCHLQPGIESLSTPILKKMEKGTTGVQNVRVLRDITELGITATWNILAGFPDETIEDYAPLLDQMHAMVHIQPPTGIGRIAVERFSPYYNKPHLGFDTKRPAGFYEITFGLPEEELSDMVYLFESEKLGMSETQMQDIQSRLEGWSQDYQSASSLTYEITADGILIRDTRKGWPRTAYLLDDPVAETVFKALLQPKSRRAVRALGTKAVNPVSMETIDAVLADLKTRGLVFEENDCFVALPTAQAAIQIRMFNDAVDGASSAA